MVEVCMIIIKLEKPERIFIPTRKGTEPANLILQSVL